jgi:putative aldouronate transport system substrate-binding protein
MKKVMFVLVAVCMLAAMLLPGCATNAPTTAPTSAPAGQESTAPATEAEPSEAAALEPYTFTHYFNYDWWGIKPWAEDEVSKYYQKKYNITVEFSKPDSDPKAKLTLMMSSGDLPDSIMMDRGEDNIKLARGNFLVPIETYMEKNKSYEDAVLPQTIKQLQIDGKLYGIPNWPRKGATGGNDVWIYDTRLWEAAGKPDLSTFEGLKAYALKAKGTKNPEGLDVIPFATDTLASDQARIARAFYRSMGGVLPHGWYTVAGGKFESAFRDPVFKQAVMEANDWYRQGLIVDTQFSDTEDQITEKLVNGRVALAYYDHSKNETNRFRTLRMQTAAGTFELTNPPYPPANGLSKDKIYADWKETIGWNVTCITTKAKYPERIYTLWTDFLTLEGSMIMMYGPKGPDFNWEQMDADGLPILKKAESELSEEEYNKLGCWFWAMPGQSDFVDQTKFAVNAKLPPEKQNWVITQQANVLTPIMFVDDEFVGIPDVIDAKSQDGVNRTTCEDQIKAQLPKIIQAASVAEAEKLYNELVDFLDKNGMPAIETAYNTKWQQNCADYGGSKINR